jgi:hypothetical protein
MNNEELKRLRMLAGTAEATSEPEYTAPKTVQQIMEHYVPVEEAYGNDVDRRAIDNADREPKKKVSVKPAPWDKEIDEASDEDNEIARHNALAGLDRELKKKVSVKPAPWDKEIDEASSSPQSGSIESYIHTPEADDVPVTVHYEIDTAEPDVNYGGGIHLHVEDANGNEVEISSADQDRFEQEVNDKGQDDMDEYGDYEMHRRQDNAMESSDEDSEIARMSALAGLDKEPKKKVSVKKAPWDNEIDEAGSAILTQDDIAKKVADKLNPDADRYDQITAIKQILSSSGQKILATDREFIDDVLDILYDNYDFRPVDEAIDEASDEDSEIARMSALAGLDKEPKKKVSVKPAPWDKEINEAAKPDFADIDDDGDKDETAKKAADDKEAMSEQQQMREWSNSVYKQYDDRGHVMDQPEGETVDLSLRRYLNAEPSKVSIAEDITVESLAESYKKFKGKK